MSNASTSLAVQARETLTDEGRLQLIKTTAMAPEATDDEFRLFLTVANRMGLDPLARQIYAIHRRVAQGRLQMTIQTGIDGFRAIAEDSGEYAGRDRPIFEYAADNTERKHPDVAIVTVYRLVGGIRCPFTAEARWDEYVQRDRDGKLMGQWPTMGHNQLAKCAEAQALRAGFPKKLSGVYTDDEMGQADNPARAGVGGAGGTVEQHAVDMRPRGNATSAKPPAKPSGDAGRPYNPLQDVALRQELNVLGYRTVADVQRFVEWAIAGHDHETVTRDWLVDGLKEAKATLAAKEARAGVITVDEDEDEAEGETNQP
jgi:phage recombination protein Bet